VVRVFFSSLDVFSVFEHYFCQSTIDFDAQDTRAYSKKQANKQTSKQANKLYVVVGRASTLGSLSVSIIPSIESPNNQTWNDHGRSVSSTSENHHPRSPRRHPVFSAAENGRILCFRVPDHDESWSRSASCLSTVDGGRTSARSVGVRAPAAFRSWCIARRATVGPRAGTRGIS